MFPDTAMAAMGPGEVAVALVMPLYLAVAKIYGDIRDEDVTQNQDDIESNEDDIQEIKESQARIEAELDELKAGQRILHDNLIDHNPCESESCEWCVPPEEKGPGE